MDFSEIRKIALGSTASGSEVFSVFSNLNWIRYKKQIGEISKFIPHNSKILDVGCGRGATTAMIKKTNPDSEVIGIDLKKFTTWDEYQRYDIKFSVGDAMDLKFEDNEFNIIVSFGVIEHVTNDQKFIKENLRVLKNNGIGFILNIPNKYSINEFFAKKLGIWSHEKKYNLSEIKTLLKSNGIENFVIKQRFLIPAQIGRVHHSLDKSFNKLHRYLDFLDRLLCRSPLNLFSQVFDVFYKKES